MYGPNEIEQVERYKHLGVTLDETLTYRDCTEELARSAGRALGSVMQKMKTYGNMGFRAYDKLVRSCVFSIMDYGAEVTGFKTPKCMEDVQNRAARLYMGVNRSCPLPCLQAEMGWMSIHRRRLLSVLRYHRRLIRMPEYQLPRRLYNVTKNSRKSWYKNYQELLDDLGLQHYMAVDIPVPPDVAELFTKEKYLEDRRKAIDERVKLRTYKTLIVGLQPGEQIKCNITRKHRSLISQLKCGILQLRLEVGRHNQEALNDRVCQLCSLGEVETEEHFLFICPAYRAERHHFTELLSRSTGSIKELLRHPFVLGKYLEELWRKRAVLTVN